MGRFISLALKSVVVSAGLAVYFGGSAHAATITVTTTAMTSTPTACTLYDALEAANTNSAVNGCAAGDALPTVDSISIPAGSYDTNGYDQLRPTESVILQGASAEGTVIANNTIYPTMTDSGARFEIHNLSLVSVWIPLDTTETGQKLDQAVIDHVKLDGSSIRVMQRNSPVHAVFSNIKGINSSTITVDSDMSGAGNVLIKNSELTGGAYDGDTAIFNTNPRANARVDVENSSITGYTTGLSNFECTAEWVIASLYITDSQIGGGGMQQGVLNQCGHVIIKNSTFHAISGAAVLAWTNFMPVLFGVCQEQAYSKIEIYNSTFTNINVTGSYTIPSSTEDVPETLYPGVITLDSRIRSTCVTEQSQVTDSELVMLHNTFANNTFTNAGSVDLALTDGTTMNSMTLQNNALEGNPLAGNFSVSGLASMSGNLTTGTYAGPNTFAGGFTRVAGFMLGTLRDNGGALLGVDGDEGRVLTLRPLAGSPLIDAVPSAGLTDDQRGVARSMMARYDVGSVEVTVAEFTADGGVYAPSDSTSTPTTGRLAETGSNTLLVYGIGVVLVLMGCVVLVVRQG